MSDTDPFRRPFRGLACAVVMALAVAAGGSVLLTRAAGAEDNTESCNGKNLVSGT